MGAIELHPWGARVERIDYPDRLIFDLDPDQGVPFDAVKNLRQRICRQRLSAKGLDSYLREMHRREGPSRDGAPGRKDTNGKK